jgi:hypothetical protein
MVSRNSGVLIVTILLLSLHPISLYAQSELLANQYQIVYFT